ncbi:2-C-methyl-D-erythritol 4-phosphate cytidylyltransferase [Blautia fusiformis]|uniref:2-C-methyl-D-erythritol 4-phosphate cytidylyltransferase n=1 Tax=Blautia fusiformis TaxID=2881264 RepID=UPI002F419423
MNIAVIFAGGVGSRMHSKDRPKQFLEMYNKPIIIHTLEYFENHSMIDAIVVVCIKDWIATVYKGNIIKNLIMDCQSYTKYRPNETTGGIFVSWRRKEELPTGA